MKIYNEIKEREEDEDWSSQRLQVEDLKIWDSTRIYNSGRISGATNKGTSIKARYLSTPGAQELGRSINVIEIQDDIVYIHCNLY
jgi:hypothetical protein